MAKKKLPPEVLEYFREQGSIGGKAGGSLGGKVAAQSMTPEQRVERAKRAVAAREANRAKAKAIPTNPNR
jgi:hypothetical protein